MTIPLLLKLFVIAAGVGIAGIVLCFVAWVVAPAVQRRAARKAEAEMDDVLREMQNGLARQGRLGESDHIGDIRICRAIANRHPLLVRNRRPRGRRT
ncbi:hypothetical protein [Labedaea rhizosphaerae]|uniref:Uncharacterized protein n=1 Tax=Labedaea rhizosphaerae TaxID=598644 RepID=A0A4R6SDC9_LABRH|nr:hypothetical protein [Labedaea rhizosphaerae]TDP97674.1 hypothetical protein EV186_103638 [Labedaea rhizosphaerae]